ncbi:MAG: hypothetical protein A2157_11425 [Deltaproteobacteria bacterium RBG_16_47_11]|nr:MAG: hypothetical protein A2157_11425 [Deltaproteobacteria bacterium RBG_16_47_11]
MTLPFFWGSIKKRCLLLFIRNRGYWEESIFGELDGFGGALVDAGPTLNAFFWMDRIRFILFHLIDLAWASLDAVPTT